MPNFPSAENSQPPGKVLRLVTRNQWLAQPPNVNLSELHLPVDKIIIAHTASESCDTQAECTYRVRLIQTFHIESKKWDDIGYSFMIGGDGAVYEGRGWNKIGAHTLGYNKGSIGVAFIGTFNKIVPNEKMINAFFKLYQEGIQLKKLTEDFKIYAHRQLISTESPGEVFYKIIKTWDHWSNELP